MKMLLRKNTKKLNQKLIKYGVILIAIVMVAMVCVIGYKNHISSETKITKIGFEDIGELATQTAYCTEVNVTDTSKEVWGLKIPFTQSKYIYSYDFVIKAGFDFQQITWEESNNKITVHLPEVEILSCEVVDDSLKVFHEKESIFRKVTLEEHIDTLENMKDQAKENAVANGLYDNAKINAETMLTVFFGNVYDMSEYQIEFVYD